MDVLDILKIAFVWIVTFAPRIFDILTRGLNTTKAATDAVESAQKLLPIIHRGENEPKSDDEPDITPDQAAERIYALSELMRSYAIYGFLEFALWVSRWFMLYLMFVKLLEWTRIRMQEREAKKP